MVIGCGYVGLKYVVPLMMPFIIAWVFATIIHWAASKVASFMSRTKLKKLLDVIGFKNIIKIILAIFYMTVGISLFAIISGLVEWSTNLPRVLMDFYTSVVQPIFADVQMTMTSEAVAIDPTVLDAVKEILTKIIASAGDFINSILSWATKWATGLISSIPNFIWSTVMCLIATAFLAVDYAKINAVVKSLIPCEYRDKIMELLSSALSTIPKFLRGYAIVLCITFVEVFVWLLVLKVNNALPIAVFIALLDIMPILGTGTVVIPWSVYSLLSGNVPLGLALMLMYISITVIRQYIEPKIIGHEIGVYPIVTLLSMFIGQQLFGLGGLLGLPVIAAVSINEFKKYVDEKGCDVVE